MIQVTTNDKTLLRELTVFVEPVEINDAEGNIVGVFVPAYLQRAKRLYEQPSKSIDLAELDRRAAFKGKCKTTREVFEGLLELTTDPVSRGYLQETINDLKERDACPSR